LTKNFDTFRQNFRKTSFSTKKDEKKTFSGKFFVILPNNFFHKFFYPVQIENKHIEVENQFLFKLQKSLIVLQWLYLPSGLYNLISFSVKNIIRRPWSLLTQLLPEISLDPLRRAESSLNFCIRCEKSGINFNQFHYNLKSMFKKSSSVNRE